MDKATHGQQIFFTCIRTVNQRKGARILINSIREFGGELKECPIWLFEADPKNVPCASLESDRVQVLPLSVPESIASYYYGDKVYACTRAEELVSPDVQSLVWISPENLIIQPPLLFDLAGVYDVAVRPVHHINVGLQSTAPLNEFWKGVYQAVGVSDVQYMVDSFIEAYRMRAYFNSAAFALNPSAKLSRRWFECFETLVTDPGFQAGACQDEWHQVFLHQAVLSSLIAAELDPDRIHILPPDYIYPYNLQQDVPLDRQAQTLNDLVCVYYGGRSLNPDDMDDIHIHEPLRSWMADLARASFVGDL